MWSMFRKTNLSGGVRKKIKWKLPTLGSQKKNTYYNINYNYYNENNISTKYTF